MIPEDYVSYPIALALKKAGFDWPCIAQWACEPDGKPILVGSTAFVFSNATLKGRDVTAPLIYQAQKWLREVKGYIISVHPESKFFEKTYQHTGWNYSIILISKTGIMFSGPIGNILVEKYEQAISAGIEAALELIKEPKSN